MDIVYVPFEWNSHGKSQYNGSGACWMRTAHYIAFYLRYLGVICAIVYNDFSLCLPSRSSLSTAFIWFFFCVFFRLFTFHLGCLGTHVSGRIRMSTKITIQKNMEYMMNGHWILWILETGQAACITSQFISLVEGQTNFHAHPGLFMISRFRNATCAEKSKLFEWFFQLRFMFPSCRL